MPNKIPELSDFKDIKISNFTYNLPNGRIAKYPLKKRDKSKLLIWKNASISESTFANCTNYLPENSLLVFNNTRVINARLFFRKETGAKIEIFCLEPVEPADYQIAFQQKKQVIWKCLIGNSKKWKAGVLKREIEINGEKITIQAEKTEQVENTFHIKYSWNKVVSFAEIIEQAGTLPIPPYLNRETEESDEETYQTIYAKFDGSVAAPTAGLHFTNEVLNTFHKKNITTQEITLHVGAGTFQPVKSESVSKHSMHHETVIIQKNIIESLLKNSGNIIAVGTTSVRSLESLYWIGLQLEKKSLNHKKAEVLQWEPYKNEATISTNKALQNVIGFLEKTNKIYLQFSTQIIILPGYDFKIIRGMFTNFHQPQSTLLLLIGAFVGKQWKEIYDYALKYNFRFLSYGDSNLYLK